GMGFEDPFEAPQVVVFEGFGERADRFRDPTVHRARTHPDIGPSVISLCRDHLAAGVRACELRGGGGHIAAVLRESNHLGIRYDVREQLRHFYLEWVW